MLLAACAAQPTSPADAGDGSDPEGSIISLEVNPSRAVIQPNDTIVFDVEMVVSEDLESIPDLEWTASRGSISSDGVFIAGRRAGKIDVTVKPRGREKKARAEIHVVEEEPPVASSVEISPETASLNSGETQSLSAAVLDQNGAPMSLTPVWSALGGTITRGGEYTAGAVEGLFPVAATVSPDVADTAWITITSLPPDTQDTQPVGPAGNWSLIMADEFDDAALDPALWHTAQPWSNALINGQQQLYDNCPYPWQTWMTVCAPTPHVVEQGGTLRLIATDDEISTADWTYPFTSGAVNTIDLAWFTAPLAVEIRAKPPAGRGLWTELWLHPDLGTWPDGGEIDILELLGENPYVAHQTVHWGENGSDAGSGEPFNNGTDWTSGFHTYTVEWTASAVTFWIDGVQTHRVAGHSPQGRMHLIMDLAVGGSWPVPPDASTPWPSILEIEYVRVWER
jgi:beta-glucanase (GH16 family)